jgi:hypothetical protein
MTFPAIADSRNAIGSSQSGTMRDTHGADCSREGLLVEWDKQGRGVETRGTRKDRQGLRAPLLSLI